MDPSSPDIKPRIEKANQETVNRMNAADPVLVDVAPARDVIPGLNDRMILLLKLLDRTAQTRPQ